MNNLQHELAVASEKMVIAIYNKALEDNNFSREYLIQFLADVVKDIEKETGKERFKILITYFLGLERIMDSMKDVSTWLLGELEKEEHTT